ncbi:MAG: zinc ribbon domain-containing protein [Phycisphaerae bacterium]|nr:zinc ribbon domain-containing protein [Phycisphaerae bacterium]
MPLYEYVSQADGEVIELLRAVSQADEPVPDPKGLGRVFVRKLSTFAPLSSSGPTARNVPLGGACGCGKPHGTCRGAS